LQNIRNILRPDALDLIASMTLAGTLSISMPEPDMGVVG